MSETWFDREVCTCGVMHERYACCGVPADYCASHGHDDEPRDSDEYERGLTDSMLRSYQYRRILEDLIAELREGSMLPWTGISVDEARRTLSGLHFAKEALSEGERNLLYIAEGLLRLIDQSGLATDRAEQRLKEVTDA